MCSLEQGDRIGMLLDLDQGSMSLWKNGVELGVMQAEGLTGPGKITRSQFKSTIALSFLRLIACDGSVLGGVCGLGHQRAHRFRARAPLNDECATRQSYRWSDLSAQSLLRTSPSPSPSTTTSSSSSTIAPPRSFCSNTCPIHVVSPKVNQRPQRMP